MNSTQTQNRSGHWVPAIPLPYFLAFGWVRCAHRGPDGTCGVVRRGQRRYREHYALTHILELE